MSSLNSVVNGDVRIVYFADTQILQEGKIQQLGKELLAIAGKTEGGKLLLNFEDVKFMSSAMLGKLVQLNKECKKSKTTLKMCGISPEIHEIFSLTKMDKIFDLQPDEAKALAAFAKRGWLS